MTTVELDDSTAKAFSELELRARERHLPLDEYLYRLFSIADQVQGRGAKRLSSRELEQLLADIDDGEAPAAPLPDDFSRADIYIDHD